MQSYNPHQRCEVVGSTQQEWLLPWMAFWTSIRDCSVRILSREPVEAKTMKAIFSSSLSKQLWTYLTKFKQPGHRPSLFGRKEN